MKSSAKVTVGIVGVLAIAGGVAASVRWSQRDLVTVQTGKVSRIDLSAVVTASGEIKPRNYINLGANAMGPLADIFVQEGDRVRRGQVVARIENTQAGADVNAQQANIQGALADSAAAEEGLKAQDAAIKTQVATLERFKNEMDRSKVYLDRYKEMWDQHLVAKQDYDQKKSDYDSAVDSVRENEARVAQMEAQRSQTAAQLASAQKRVAQAQAQLTRLNDVLAKFDVVAPLDGLVTYLPLHIGETVVQGVQNSAASTIMTIADMSLITAEVKVDETDIVNVHLGQEADVSIEAIPNRTFKGKVTEIGNMAILRSSGLAASQSTTSNQEAKDFKVVIALSDPPSEIRPGLSATAKITTATRQDVLAIPIQALTVRTKGDLEDQSANAKNKDKDNQAPIDLAAQQALREEIQGVFVIKGDHAEFHKVDTGIAGATDIEVLSGLDNGDQIVIGSYKTIRTMRNNSRVKIDNRTPVSSDTKS